MVLLARAMLHDPYWPLHAAETLGDEVTWPKQYGRVRTTSIATPQVTRSKPAMTTNFG